MTAFNGGFNRSTQHFIIVFVVPGILSLVDEKQNAEYHNSYPHDLACFIKFTLHEKQYLEEIKATQPDENGYRYKSFVWGPHRDGAELVCAESDGSGLWDCQVYNCA